MSILGVGVDHDMKVNGRMNNIFFETISPSPGSKQTELTFFNFGLYVYRINLYSNNFLAQFLERIV